MTSTPKSTGAQNTAAGASTTDIPIEATAEIVHDDLKRGNVGRWEILSDHPVEHGGMDVAPSPLHYFATSILF